jgi:hypothetical protein
MLVIVLLAVAGWLTWRWYGQTVDVLIVNASSNPGQFSWQPQVFGDPVTDTVGGCESKSIQLRAGEHWEFQHGRYRVTSSAVDVPPFVGRVTVEIHLEADGSARFVAAYPVDGPVDALYPSGCAVQGGPTPTSDRTPSPAPGISIDCGPFVDHDLCLQAVDVATRAKINPPPVAGATLRRPRPDDECITWFHPCGPEALIVDLRSGDTILAVPLVRSTGGWARLDSVR